MYKRLLAVKIGGYSIRRWFPTVLAILAISAHAVASPFWYRVTSGTRVVQTEIVTTSGLGGLFFGRDRNGYRYETSHPVVTRRTVQRARDAERLGATRSAARGAIAFPMPSVVLELPEARRDDRDIIGHSFQCDYLGEDCSISVQSTAHFVQIVQGPQFSARIIVDRPVLFMRASSGGVRLDGLGLPDPQFWSDDTRDIYENFPTGLARLATTDGRTLDLGLFSSGLLRFGASASVVSLPDPPFNPVDLVYTLDFTQPELNYLEHCRLIRRAALAAADGAPLPDETCTFDPDEISVFILAQCDGATGPCPTPSTDPAADMLNQSFDPAGLVSEISLGFLGRRSDELYAIANRAIGRDTRTGLIDFPDRTTIMAGILMDYLAIAGPSATSPELERFFVANSDLNLDAIRGYVDNVTPDMQEQLVRTSLGRQPQLWAWHGLAHEIGPELLNAVARDLVKMGLANPY